MKYYIYIVRCADTTLYTGITTDVTRRILEHNADNILGAKYTRTRRPVVLVFHKECANRSVASKEEWLIKRLSRREKERLIATQDDA